MEKFNILYFTTNTTCYIYKIDHYFKMELTKLPNVHIHFREEGGNVREILKQLDFTPDFIYFDDLKHINRSYGIPTGLNQTNIPKGVLFQDVHKTQELFTSFVKENRIDLIFAQYRDAFLNFFPQYKEQFRWLPLHINNSIFRRYKETRTIDFLMMGSTAEGTYPLRWEMYRQMGKKKGVVYHPHPGNKNFSAVEQENIFLDEKYAMEINRAQMFLTCGSKYNYPLGKYFEIPGCNTLLLASGFPELRDLGFINKETYVEINKLNFNDKAKYYLKHKDERKVIRKQGFAMVHSRHTTGIRVREFIDVLKHFTGK